MVHSLVSSVQLQVIGQGYTHSLIMFTGGRGCVQDSKYTADSGHWHLATMIQQHWSWTAVQIHVQYDII